MSNKLQELDKIPYIDVQGNKKYLEPSKMLQVRENYVDLTEVANQYFLVSSLADKINRTTKALQKELDSLHSKLYIKYVNDPALKETNGGRKPSENMINSYVESDTTYKEASMKVIDSQYRYSVLKDLQKALEMKQNLLQTISANNRVEKQTFGSQSVLKVQKNN